MQPWPRIDWYALRSGVELALRKSGLPPSTRVDGRIISLESGANHDNFILKLRGDEPSALLDERLLLRFGPDGSTAVTRAAHDATARAWVPLSTWSAIRHSFTFSDSRTGRQFEADLRRETLGGTWRTPSLVGGWWCDAIAADDSPAAADAFRSEALMPPLIPERMATPTYPRQAIRDAKQGRAVACFFVDADGVILDPQIVELSDEVFRAPSLEALGRSRYRGWGAGAISRPGCRSFIYRLDAANERRPLP